MSETVAFVARHGYLLLFVWILIEQAALPLPSVPLLLAAGALAKSGNLHAGLAIGACVTASLLPNLVWFFVGRARGTRVLRFLCRIAIEPDSCVRRTENIFTRYGMRALLVSRFVPGLNAVAAPMAGRSGVGLARFLMFDAAGAVLWATLLIGTGYAFSSQLETVAGYLSQTGSGLLVFSAAITVGWILVKWIQRERFLRKVHQNRITVEELRVLLDSGEPTYIVDLRGELDGDASIPGALRFTATDLMERHWEIPRDREIILFCS